MILILWLIVSLSTMGVACFFFSLVYWVYPTQGVHQWMWGIYANWSNQLGYLVEWYIPKISLRGDIPKDKAFVLIANHYSWLDILVLFAKLRGRSFVFVMKRSLKYLPIIGLVANWLGFPFVDRGRSLEGNRIALEKSAKKADQYGYGIVIFPEGTRYTKSRQKSKYKHLLRPKWAGLECLLENMSNVSLVDATIVYEKENPGVFDVIFNRVGKVILEIEAIEINGVKETLVERWAKKDLQIEKLKSQF